MRHPSASHVTIGDALVFIPSLPLCPDRPVHTIAFSARRQCVSLGLALLLAGCTDDQQPITAPDAAHPASVVSVSDDGVISASMELPFAPGTGEDWFMWGRFPEHEELRVPAGPHEVEFDVSGGVSFMRKPGVEPWHTSSFEGLYIGIGGVRLPDEVFPALRLQMGYVHAEFEGQDYPPLYAWQAEPYSTAPAHGKVILTGPGRIIFNRHYNSGWFTHFEWATYEGKRNWRLWDWVSDQRVSLTIRPLTKIKLDCGGGTVARGDSIGCHVSADPPGGTLTNIQWSFTDSAGVTVSAPNGTGDRWGGTMVTGGEISVSAILNGDSVGDTKRIAVRARNWPRLQLSTPAHDSLHGHLPVIPTVLPNGHLANPGELADSHLERNPYNMPWGNNYVGINSGPNTGYWYVTQPLRRPTFLVHTSDAFSPGNPWYERQHGPHPYCSKHDVRNILRRRARAHEGIDGPIHGDPYQPTYSHYSAARHWFASQVDVNKMFEEKVFYLQPGQSGFTFTTFVQALEVMWVEQVQVPHTSYNNSLVHTPQNLMLMHCLLRP